MLSEKVIAIWIQTHINVEEGLTNYLPLLISPYFLLNHGGKLVVRMSHKNLLRAVKLDI